VNGASDSTWQGAGDGTLTQSATIYTWTVDTTAPAAVFDLAAMHAQPASTSVELTWSAVEGSQKGYRIWYADAPITDQTIAGAVELYAPIIPGARYHIESFAIDGLSPGQTYHFAVRSIDAASNSSAVSNSPSTTTSGVRPAVTDVALTAGGTQGDNGSTRELTITGTHLSGLDAGNIIRFSSDAVVFDMVSKTGGSSTAIRADIPVGAPTGVYQVGVINRYGTSSLSGQEYTITAAATPLPEVRTALPAMGRNDLWTLVQIEGHSFDPNAVRITLGRSDGTVLADLEDVRWESVTQMSGTVPIGVHPGQYHVQVHNPNGSYNWVSAVTYEVYGPIDICDITGSIETTGGIDMPDDGVVWHALTLSTDNRPEATDVSQYTVMAKALLAPGTAIYDEYDVAYTDAVDAPRQVALTQEMKDRIQNQLNADPSKAVVFTMGSPTEPLRLGEGQAAFVELEMVLPSAIGQPTLYYIDADGDLTLAGIDGSWQGRAIQQGGTSLALRPDVPEPGLTTHTLGLVTDHMSTFGAAAADSKGKTPASAHGAAADTGPAGEGGGSGCFVTESAANTSLAILAALLLTVFAAAGLKRMLSVLFLILLAGWILHPGIAQATESGDTGSSKLYREAAQTVNRMPAEAVDALDRKLSKALISYYDGDFTRSLPMFQEVAAVVETMDILFWMGMSARHTGEHALAVETFRKMLRHDPALHRVRLELATVYFTMGRYADARRELETVSASSPPKSVRQNVERLLAKIDAESRKGTWSVNLSQAYMWDDNISRSTAEKELDIFGGGFAPDAAFRPLAGGAFVTNVSGNLLYDIGKKRGWAWSSTALLSSTVYQNYSRFNLLVGDVSTGPWRFLSKAIVKIPVGFTKISYGSDQLSYILHLAPSIEYVWSPAVSLKGLISYGHTDYYENSFADMDNDKIRGELSGNLFLFDRRHIVSLSAGVEDADAKGGKYAYDGYYGGLTYFTTLPTRAELIIRYQWMEKDYPDGKALPLYSDYRNDERQSVSIGLSRKLNRRTALSFSYAFARNDSNLALYTYERQTFSAGLAVRF